MYERTCIALSSNSQGRYGTVTYESQNKCVLRRPENVSWTVEDADDRISYGRYALLQIV